VIGEWRFVDRFELDRYVESGNAEAKSLLFAKTPARREINNIAAAIRHSRPAREMTVGLLDGPS
jgi:hypothetical protein